MLTIDIGNTHIKWALWDGGVITRRGSCGYQKQEPEPAFAVWQDMQPQDRVFVANVAGDAIGQALYAWIRARWPAQVEFLRSAPELLGVTNAYADPGQYGVDRWAALLGAYSRNHAPACIIDAGTAVTVDLLDAGGLHRGGRILPGLSMMREALLGRTAGIHRVDGNPVLFADNTADAVSSGTLHMLRAALLEIIESARQCLGDGMKIIITGGMSEQIMSLPELPDMVHEPDLVLIGLHAVAESRIEGS